jgi:PIN domain nuclease of toxin-antitoxin system
VSYLLDTHILLWWVEDDPRVRADRREKIADPSHEVVASVASIWEAAIERAVGKLRFETMTLLDALSRGGFACCRSPPSTRSPPAICRGT